jgi:thioredoxin 1
MPASVGKAAVVVALLLAIGGVVYLKGQQQPEAATLPRVQAERAAAPAPQAPPARVTSPTPSTVERTAPTPPPRKPTTTSRPAPPAPRQAPAAGTTKVTTAPKPASLPRLLELGADRCVPCKMMQPVLAELRQEYAGKLQVDFIDVWKDPSAGEPYGIQTIPTQILYDANGTERFRHSGFYPKDEILAKFHELGIAL